MVSHTETHTWTGVPPLYTLCSDMQSYEEDVSILRLTEGLIERGRETGVKESSSGDVDEHADDCPNIPASCHGDCTASLSWLFFRMYVCVSVCVVVYSSCLPSVSEIERGFYNFLSGDDGNMVSSTA